jgi:hypothetical protein
MSCFCQIAPTEYKRSIFLDILVDDWYVGLTGEYYAVFCAPTAAKSSDEEVFES